MGTGVNFLSVMRLFAERAKMETREREIKGTAYLIGGSKEATEKFIEAFAGAMPDKEQARQVRANLKKKLIRAFSFQAEIDYPESDQELLEDFGEEKAMKMVASKHETNQLDKLRNEHAKEIADSANIVELTSEILKS